MPSDQELAARAKELSIAMPSFAATMPGAAVATMQLGPEWLRTASQIEGLREAVFEAQRLRRLPEDHQYSLWGDLDKGMQDRLASVGYDLPHRTDPGFFERNVGSKIGWVFSQTVGNVIEFANKAASGVTGNIQHWFRAARLMEMEQDQRERGDPTAPGGFFSAAFSSPEQWGRAWEKTKEGDQFIPFFEEQLQSKGISLPKQFAEVARDKALGFSDAELTAVHGETALEAFEHTSFQDAAKVLEDSYVSVGRLVASGLGLDPGSKPFDLLSGTADGLVLWFADPFNVVPVGKLAKMRSFRRLAHDARTIRLAAGSSPRVQRGLGYILDVLRGAEQFDNGKKLAAGRLRRDMPQLTGMVDDLIEANPQSYDELVDFFGAKAGVTALAAGREPGLWNLDQVSLGAIQEHWTKFKGSDAVQGLADLFTKTQVPGAKQLARGVRRMATRVPRGALDEGFDPTSKDAFEIVRMVAQMGLPTRQVNEVLDLWSASNLAGKRTLYTGLIESLRDVVARGNPELDTYFRRLIDNMDDGLNTPGGVRYADDLEGNELGLVADPATGAVQRFGVLDYQVMNTKWAVPDMRVIAEGMQAVNKLRGVWGFGWLPQGLVNKFMDRAWRKGKVLTPGQGFRQGIEEIAGYALENGWVTTFKARLAGTAAKRAKQLGAKGAVAENLAIAAKRGLGPTAVRISDDGLFESALELAEFTDGRLMLGKIDPHNFDQLDYKGSVKRATNARSTTVKRFKLVGRGRFRGYQPGEQLFVVAWQKRLQNLLFDSPQAKVAVSALKRGDDADAAMRAWLLAPEQRQLRESSALFQELTRILGSEDAAIERWARESVESVRSLTHAPDGSRIDEVFDAFSAGKIPEHEVLEALPFDRRPLSITAEDMAEISVTEQGLVEAVTEKGMELIDKQMAWVSRQPMMVAEYHEASKAINKQLETLRAAGLSLADETAYRRQWAVHVAAQRVYPHIDDPLVRTQWAESHRALTPFWYAQDLFIRRWGKRVIRAPEVARRAALTMHGFEHSGIMKRDPSTGDLMFHYPVMGPATGVLMKGLGLLTGNNVYNSISVGFTGRLKYLAPGIADPVRPGVGPFVSIALNALKQRFPELGADLSRTAQGDFASQPIWRQLAPTVAVKILSPIIEQEQQASLVLGAMQQLEASGHGLPAEADAAQKEAYIARVRGAATGLGVLRGIFGITAPGGPALEFAGDLQPELVEFLRVLPLEEAYAAFLRRHPDADAWTVFRTEAVEGAQKPLPPTRSAGDFYLQHKDFFHKHGVAASWLLPDAQEGFDPVVWREQMASGLRRQKAPEDFWMQLVTASASREYWAAKDLHEQTVQGLLGPSRDFEDDEWARWREMFFVQHPALEQHLAAGGVRSVLRQQTMAQLVGMLQDPALPQVAHLADLEQVVNLWKGWATQRDALSGRRDSMASILRSRLDDDFRAQVATLSPVAQTLFDTNIRPDMPEF